MTITCLSINARGLNHPAKRFSLWKEANKQKADILCVQETHFQLNNTPYCAHKDYPYLYMACTPHHKKGGVLLASKNSLSFQPKDIVLDEGGRYIIATGDINSKPYTIVTLYAPNSHQIRFIKKVLYKANFMKYGNLLICGDFNATPDPFLDTSSDKSKGALSLQSLLHKEELFDTWRCLHANKRDYTFFSSRHCSYSRIDLFLADKWLLQNVETTRIHDITWSDHAAISMSVAERGVSSSPSIWCCNTRIFQEPQYHKTISQHLKHFFLDNTGSVNDPYILCNSHKAFMRAILI